MGKREKLLRMLLVLSLSVPVVWTACGGGGGSTNGTGSTTYNASAAAGDFITFTSSGLNDFTYENFTTGRVESGTYAQDPVTGELTFTATTSTGGGSGDGSASELATGFMTPGIGIVLVASYTGAAADKESIVFGVPLRTHSLGEIIGIVAPGSGGSADYVYLQFRTNEGGFELGAAKILEEQDFTDSMDIDNDGFYSDTITGAPLLPASYSPVYGMPDPAPGGSIDMTLSTDIIDQPSTPFLELAPDASYTILRSWEYDTCNQGDPGCTPTLAQNILFFNDTLEKFVIDSTYFSGIALKMSPSDGWSSQYEGTYTMVSYVGSGTAYSTQDTAGVPDTLELVFGNDGGGNGTISAGPLGGPYSTALTLTSFNQMAAAGSLLGNPASPWPTDGSIPLNGAFGFRGSDGTIGSETFFVFSEGAVFMVSASLDGPRISGGDLDGYPTSYSYQFGAGVKVP